MKPDAIISKGTRTLDKKFGGRLVENKIQAQSLDLLLSMFPHEVDPEFQWFEKEPRVSTRREQLRRKLPWFLSRWNTTFHLLPPGYITQLERAYR